MKITPEHNDRMAKMTFSTVYPLYITKVEKKGKIQELIDEKATFEIFFKKSKLNPNADLITGMICGYRIEEIENLLTKQVRYLDKLVDELAKGKKMEKILRNV